VTCTGAIRSGRLTSIRDVASNVSRKERSFADGAVGVNSTQRRSSRLACVRPPSTLRNRFRNSQGVPPTSPCRLSEISARFQNHCQCGMRAHVPGLQQPTGERSPGVAYAKQLPFREVSDARTSSLHPSSSGRRHGRGGHRDDRAVGEGLVGLEICRYVQLRSFRVQRRRDGRLRNFVLIWSRRRQYRRPFGLRYDDSLRSGPASLARGHRGVGPLGQTAIRPLI